MGSDDWISIISNRGLTRPSQEWLQKVVQFEVMYGSFRGTTFSKQQQIINTLAKLNKSKFPEVYMKIISLYARTRTFIRIRHVNKEIKLKSLKTYAAKKSRLWVRTQIYRVKFQ